MLQRSAETPSLRSDDVMGFRESLEEAVEGGAEEEREQDFGDEDAGEEEDSGGGEDGEAGVEGGAVAEGAVGPVVAEEGEQQDADGLGEMGGEGVEAEDAEAEGVEPVGEGRFLEVADAVDVEGDPVAGEGHVAGGVGVGGVGVVEQRRGEERGEEDDEPEAAENKERCGAAGAVEDSVTGAGDLRRRRVARKVGSIMI